MWFSDHGVLLRAHAGFYRGLVHRYTEGLRGGRVLRRVLRRFTEGLSEDLRRAHTTRRWRLRSSEGLKSQ